MTTDLLTHLGNTQDGVLVADAKQRIIFWNEGAQQILGYESDAVLGQPCNEVISGQDHHGAQMCRQNCAILRLAQRGGIPPTQTCRSRTRDGQERWLSLTHIALPEDANGGVVMAHVFRDVTRQVAAQDLMERLSAYLQELSVTRLPVPPEPATQEAIALTAREIEVLQLLAAGCSTRQIADRLVVSVSTARNHIQNILDRLGVHSRLEAVSYALQHRLIPPPTVASAAMHTCPRYHKLSG